MQPQDHHGHGAIPDSGTAVAVQGEHSLRRDDRDKRGGAGYALSIILQTILTVMRHQYIILVGYALSSVLVTFQSSMWVRTDGITGAAYSYVAASGVLFAALLVSFITLYKKESKGA